MSCDIQTGQLCFIWGFLWSLSVYICRLQGILFNLTQSLTVEETILKETFAIRIEMKQANSLGNISSLNLAPTFPVASASFPNDLLSTDVDAVTLVSAFADDVLFLPRDPGPRFVSTSVVDFTLSGVGEISNLQNPVNLSFARSDVGLRVLFIVS